MALTKVLRVNVIIIRRRSSVGKSERRAKGGVGKKCVKIRQRRLSFDVCMDEILRQKKVITKVGNSN